MIAFHEACHAAAYLIQGVVPLCVRMDLPKGCEGYCIADPEVIDTPQGRKKNLLATLASSAFEGCLNDDWPIRPDEWESGRHGDAALAKRLCEQLGFDEVDSLQYVEKARRLTSNSRYCRLLTRIADELEEKELLVKNEIAQIAKEIE